LEDQRLFHSLFRRTGEAVTLVTKRDWRFASELIEILERANQVRIHLTG